MNLPLPRWYREKVKPTPDSDDLRVSTLELFFDLVFVFTVTQLTHVLAHDFTSGIAQTVIMLAVIWYMYAAYAWLTNAVPPVRTARRVLLLAAMAAWFVVALAVPDAFHGTGVWFAGGLIAVVLIHGAMYLQSTTRIVPFVGANLVGALTILFGAFQHGFWQYALWAVGLVIMWLAPAITGQEGFPLHPGHVTERHGLVVIITLGESIVVVGRGAWEVDLTWSVAVFAGLCLTLSACLWWAYFTRDAVRAEAALTAVTDQARRTRMVLLGFFFSHVPILLGIVAAAAGTAIGIHNVKGGLGLGPALSLSGGVAAFLVGTILFRLSLRIRFGWPRAAAVVLVLATAPLAMVAVIWQLVALVIVMVATLIVENAVTGD